MCILVTRDVKQRDVEIEARRVKEQGSDYPHDILVATCPSLPDRGVNLAVSMYHELPIPPLVTPQAHRLPYSERFPGVNRRRSPTRRPCPISPTVAENASET